MNEQICIVVSVQTTALPPSPLTLFVRWSSITSGLLLSQGSAWTTMDLQCFMGTLGGEARCKF